MKINPRFKDKRASDSLSSFSTVSLYKKKFSPFLSLLSVVLGFREISQSNSTLSRRINPRSLPNLLIHNFLNRSMSFSHLAA